MWPFKKKPKKMPVDLATKYRFLRIVAINGEVFPNVGIRKWLDKWIFPQGPELPIPIGGKCLEELLNVSGMFSVSEQDYEYPAFAVQYYMVDVLGYSYCHVDYLDTDGTTLVLTYKP